MKAQSVFPRMSGAPSRVMKFLGAGAAAFLFSFPLSFPAKAIIVNFANLAGTELDFSGGAFTFTSTGGNQFYITSVTGGVGDSVNLNGYISPGGPFTIGTITTTTIGSETEQTAPVTGTGTLNITDSSSINLTGSIQWDSITTIGSLGVLDLSGTVNLTALSYTGANSDLQALAAGGSGSDVVTFQFTPAQTLTQLDTTGGETSYSGSIDVVPEPATWTLLTASIGFWGVWRLRMRSRRTGQ